MIIDDHVHVGTLEHYGGVATDFMKLHHLGNRPAWWDESRTWRIEDVARTGEQVVRDMDKYGIDKSCLLPFVAIPRKCRVPNDWVAREVQKYPDRLIGFASVDPLAGLGAVRELDYAIEKLGFRGLKLAVAYNMARLDDRRIWPLWQRAEELGIPVLVHTGYAWNDCPIDWQDPLLLDEVGLAFPELKLVICHVALPWQEYACWLADKYPNWYVEVSFIPELGMDYTMRVCQLIKAVGLMDRALYGTDYPWASPNNANHFKKLPKMAKERGNDPTITDEDIKKLLGGNMARLLKL